MRVSITDRNGDLQGRADRLSLGFLRFYSGTVPAGADASLSGNTLIVQLALPNPACATPSGGSMNFNVIPSGIVASSGTPTFARFVRSDGVEVVADMDVPDELSLLKTAWTAGEPFPGPSITWSQGAE